MRFALISNVLPPSETSHAAILQRLLRDFDPESYCLLSSRDYTRGGGPDYSGRLPARYYHLPPPYQLTRGYRFGLARARERANLMLGVLLRARHIARILRRERCDRVVVCTGGNEIFDFPAGYLASRLVGARFYAYLLDQYSQMVSFVFGDTFLRRFEGPVIRGAAAVICPNEFMRDDVARRFGVNPVIIRNICDVSAYEGASGARAGAGAGGGGGARVVYTGAIGPLQADALSNLLTAFGLLGREDARLHLYTPQPRAALEANGFGGERVVVHEHEPVSAMPGVQGRADVLFLPLAFRSPYPDIVSTAAPGKIGEYLASRRPILVHAPADSFTSWYFRTHECGLVVDRDDPEELARALGRLLSDRDLRERLTGRAWERARADFDLPKARARFAELLGLDAPRGGG
ncbi:MAG TPA: glycosyltransferase [Pyrinomonadaceae bacterium]|jgi:glycosyltransferase involved in cell wall biosynthesis